MLKAQIFEWFLFLPKTNYQQNGCHLFSSLENSNMGGKLGFHSPKDLKDINLGDKYSSRT